MNSATQVLLNQIREQGNGYKCRPQRAKIIPIISFENHVPRLMQNYFFKLHLISKKHDSEIHYIYNKHSPNAKSYSVIISSFFSKNTFMVLPYITLPHPHFGNERYLQYLMHVIYIFLMYISISYKVFKYYKTTNISKKERFNILSISKQSQSLSTDFI